jgi:hypothetical protein
MDKVKNIIGQIKKLFNEFDYNEDVIFQNITEQYSTDIEKNGFNKKDIMFLIELCVSNITLSDDILKDIFLNSRNKIEQKILVSTTDQNVTTSSDNTKLDNQTLNIFSNNGSIFILPEKVILLWNNKMGNNKFKKSSYGNQNYEDEEGIKLDIKSINYFVFLDREDSITDNSLISEVTDNYLRNFGIEKISGFKTRYQLVIPLDNDSAFTSIEEPYLGECVIYMEDTNAKLRIDKDADIYKAISKFKKNIISIFSKNNIKALNLLRLFFTNNSLYPYIDIIFKSLEKTKTLIKKTETTTFQDVEEKQVNNILNHLFMTESCDHVEAYRKVYASGSYFDNVNEFIKNYINYTDGRAICVLCNESIKELNIQGVFFIDKEKFITTPDDILLYSPYNKFNNLKFFMDNLFYIFMFNTKIGIYNSSYVTRVLVDNLIFVSSKRIELEIEYKKDIIEENIFLLRLTNNFFESYDLEKERYKEKRMMYTNLPAYIIILITATLGDYYDYFFLKKRMKLDKINTNWDEIKFEDVIAYIIDSIFKNIVENYTEQTEKLRIIRIKRSIQIYNEIFNEEFKILFKEKKIVFEKYLKRLSERIPFYKIERIANFMDGKFATEFNSLGQYLLNVNKVDMLKNEKELKYYKKRDIRLEDINKNVNIDTTCYSDFIITKTYFDNKTRILNLDLFEIYDRENTKKEIQDLDLVIFEFSQEKFYSFNNQKYSIIIIDDFYILDSEKQKIQFDDSDLLDIKSLNKYTNEELIEGDIFLYLKDIKPFHFEYILRKFFIYLSKKYNITINSNLTKFCKSISKTRREVFLIKIKILNLITKLKI